MGKHKFLNFPVTFLQGFMDNKHGVLEDILHYCLYVKSADFEDEEEDERERFLLAAKYYNVIIGNPTKAFKNGKQYKYINIDSDLPHCGLNMSIFWDYYNKEKTDYQKASLLAFLALKSIIGAKPYCKVTNDFLLSRMDGKTMRLPIEELSDRIRYFSTEYRLTKIKKCLEVDWYLKYYSFRTRGFYVSFEMPIEELIYQVEKRKERYRRNKLVEEIKAAKVKALERLKNELKR